MLVPGNGDWWAEIRPDRAGNATSICGVVEGAGVFWVAFASTGNDPAAAALIASAASAALRDAALNETGSKDRGFFQRAYAHVQAAISNLEEPSSRRFKGGMVRLAVMAFGGGRVACSHVGDCRIYRLRGDVLEQLTLDHTLGRIRSCGTDWLSAREIERLGEAASTDGQYDFVTVRAIRREDAFSDRTIRQEFAEFDCAKEDTFLLVTAGIHQRLRDEDLAALAATSPRSPKMVVSHMMNVAARSETTRFPSRAPWVPSGGAALGVALPRVLRPKA